MSRVAAVILAAGRGTRFGAEPKLLAPLDGKPLVRHVAEAALASSADPVIIVTGHRAGEVEAALIDLPLRIIRNTAYKDGLSTSLKAGFADCPAETAAAVVLLGDMPLIGPALIDGLIAAWDERAEAVIPVHEGRRGNPVLLSRTLESAIEAVTGDAGAGPLLRGRADVIEWPADDPAILKDVDTAEALRLLQ
jgi:molybdenum cofactor cytidylyltransferase